MKLFQMFVMVALVSTQAAFAVGPVPKEEIPGGAFKCEKIGGDIKQHASAAEAVRERKAEQREATDSASSSL